MRGRRSATRARRLKVHASDMGGNGGRAGPAVVAWLARAATWIFYQVEVAGGTLPEGPLLLLANHPNALLDPALLIATATRRPRFLAKSTLFRMPLIGRLVKASRAIPVYRRKDAGEDVGRNVEMFEEVGRALDGGDAVCLFPEGISHSSGRLETLRTGAARIALAAASRGTRVAIVPVGLNFDRKAIFRSTVIVAYGRPFYCDQRLDVYRADSAEAVRDLTGEISFRLRDVLVEADPAGDALLVARVERLYSTARRLDAGSEARLIRRRRIAGGLDMLRARDPGRFALVYTQLQRYERRIARFGLRDEGLDLNVPPSVVIRFAVREVLLGIPLVPLAAAGALIFAIPYMLVHVLASRQEVSVDVRATWKVLGGAVSFILWIAALSVGAGALGGARIGGLTALLLATLALATLFAGEREAEVLELVRSFVAARLTPASARGRLLQQRTQIAELLEDTYAWLTQRSEGQSPPGGGRP
ncbi:MAG: 1-acyl-sn-glycerol-3-phosphate acyltransferase [Acidobacteriota bacterium]